MNWLLYIVAGFGTLYYFHSLDSETEENNDSVDDLYFPLIACLVMAWPVFFLVRLSLKLLRVVLGK